MRGKCDGSNGRRGSCGRPSKREDCLEAGRDRMGPAGTDWEGWGMEGKGGEGQGRRGKEREARGGTGRDGEGRGRAGPVGGCLRDKERGVSGVRGELLASAGEVGSGGWLEERPCLKDVKDVKLFRNDIGKLPHARVFPALSRFGDGPPQFVVLARFASAQDRLGVNHRADSASRNRPQAGCRAKCSGNSGSGSGNGSRRAAGRESGRQMERRCFWARLRRGGTPTLCESVHSTMCRACCSHHIWPMRGGQSIRRGCDVSKGSSLPSSVGCHGTRGYWRAHLPRGRGVCELPQRSMEPEWRLCARSRQRAERPRLAREWAGLPVLRPRWMGREPASRVAPPSRWPAPVPHLAEGSWIGCLQRPGRQLTTR
jgi:hypothetical protein